MSAEEEHSDDIALAGEYVLHLLDAAERKAFEARLVQEPALRDLAREWEAQLALVAQDIAPVTPPAAVKSKLESRLFAAPERASRGLRRWIIGGMLALGVIVGAAVLLPVLSPPVPSLTASVVAEDGSLVVAANFIAETNTLEIERQVGAALPGRVLELWLIAADATAPVSLGVLPEDRAARIALSDSLARQMTGAVLAISDEPPGGSPTGAPTGAVLAAGPVTGV